MRRIISCVFALILLFSCIPMAFAAENSREYFFELSVDGGATKEVQPGDIITVVFTLQRTDNNESYEMYAMQNEIRYDSEFFKLVDGSAMLSDGISTTEIGLRDTYREFYMNFVSLSAVWWSGLNSPSAQAEPLPAGTMTKRTRNAGILKPIR